MSTNIDFSKFDIAFLKVAFEESSKRVEASLTSFRQITDKSYVAVAVYFSVLAYFFEKTETEPLYWIIFGGAIFSTTVIWQNLFPGKMYVPGSDPWNSLHPFYSGKKEQLKEYYISKLTDHTKAIESNNEEVLRRHRKFKFSALIMVSAFVLTFLFFTCRIICG